MPSSPTITSYPVFSQNTKARAAEVNTNFSNHRGHNIPINTDTATASDLTHDLGADDHRWRANYVGSIDFETSTATATLIIQGQTGNTTGAFEFLIEGSTVGAFDAGGMNGNLMKDGSLNTLTAFGAGIIPTLNVLTITATQNWTAPSDVSFIICQLQGGGGGGGGGIATTTASGGGGGGAGGFVTRFVPVTPGAVYSVAIGGAGGGGIVGSGGNTGASTTFGGTLAIAAAGEPGTAGTTTGSAPGGPRGGGAGGSAGNSGTAGNFSGQFAGGAGGAGIGAAGGGGGGAAGEFGAGGAGGNAADGSGASAAANSGGGGGAGAAGATGGTGGNGAIGIAVISWVT